MSSLTKVLLSDGADRVCISLIQNNFREDLLMWNNRRTREVIVPIVCFNKCVFFMFGNKHEIMFMTKQNKTKNWLHFICF